MDVIDLTQELEKNSLDEIGLAIEYKQKRNDYACAYKELCVLIARYIPNDKASFENKVSKLLALYSPSLSWHVKICYIRSNRQGGIMGQILHPRARTTEATRREIQNSQESLDVLAKRFGINRKTVAKWRSRAHVHDMPMGAKNVRSTSLSIEEEAACVAFRRHTLLPLDDCLYALQEKIPLFQKTWHQSLA